MSFMYTIRQLDLLVVSAVATWGFLGGKLYFLLLFTS